MSDHSSEPGADNAGAERATSLPVPTIAADISGGIETLTLDDTASEQKEQSRRLIRIFESQHEALLLLVNRDAKQSTKRSGDTAKSKNYAHSMYMFAGMQLMTLSGSVLRTAGDESGVPQQRFKVRFSYSVAK
jgi:hypothetical protein